MEANVQASIGDTTFTKLIDAMVLHPLIIASFLILLTCLYMAYRRPKEAWKLLKSTFTFKMFSKHRIISKEDLKNHQFFKDIQFYIDCKIDQLYNQETFRTFDRAKLLMAHDLLMIKMKDAQKWVTSFINDTDFDDPYINLQSLLKIRIEKHNANIWNEFKKLDIPPLFIEKFIEVSKIHAEYLSLTLDSILSDQLPLSVYEKVSVMLGLISQYYTTIILRMRDVIQSINGDLKGLVYRGHVVGGNDYRCYPVPSREYIPIVEKRLQELSLSTRSKRVAIYVLHDFVGDDYLRGYFSKIYEYEAVGFTSLISKFQYKPAILLAEILSSLKQHQGISLSVNELNEVATKALLDSGIVGVMVYPIFLYDKLRGFLALEYNSIEVFNHVNKDEIMESLKKYASLLNIYLDYTKTGFTYTGNEFRD